MVKNNVRPIVLMILLATLQTKVLAQDARTLLSSAAKVLGAENIRTVHYSGRGSSYLVTQGPVPNGGWPHRVMKSYVRELNLETTTSRLQLVRTEGAPPADRTLSHTVDANSPWSSQYEFWITPHGFLKGAMAGNAAVESRTVLGTTFRVVTFTLPGNHRVVGYINDKEIIEKVETWIGDKGDVLVEAQYRDYKEFNGVQFPTVVIQKHAGALSLILVVDDVKIGK